jgi:hypothetical protein
VRLIISRSQVQILLPLQTPMLKTLRTAMF